MANVASRTNGNPSSCRRLANEGNWNCPSKFGLHVFSWGSLADGYIRPNRFGETFRRALFG